MTLNSSIYECNGGYFNAGSILWFKMTLLALCSSKCFAWITLLIGFWSLYFVGCGFHCGNSTCSAIFVALRILASWLLDLKDVICFDFTFTLQAISRTFLWSNYLNLIFIFHFLSRFPLFIVWRRFCFDFCIHVQILSFFSCHLKFSY